MATEGDCPWNRGSIATWLGSDRRIPTERLAPPFALEVAGHWLDAAKAWQDLDCPYDQALALARAGERDALSEAVELFDAIGATASAARARALLRAQGWAAPRPLRADRRKNPGGLTAREAEVLSLVSEGMSDAAIAKHLVISRRTVEHHVTAILGKLGVSSRQQAVVAAGSNSSPRPGPALRSP